VAILSHPRLTYGTVGSTLFLSLLGLLPNALEGTDPAAPNAVGPQRASQVPSLLAWYTVRPRERVVVVKRSTRERNICLLLAGYTVLHWREAGREGGCC
jgi:hypothetical protein